MATPDGISGLFGWWKADAITGLTNGATVSSWSDSSGAGRTLTATGVDTTYETNQINTLPAVHPPGTASPSNYLTATFTLAQPFTLFTVVRRDADNTLTQTPVASNGANDIAFYITNTETVGAFAGAALETATGQTVDSAHIYSYVISGASSSISIDGTSAATGDPGSTGLSGITLAAATNHFGEYFAGEIAEVILYSRALSSGERALIDSYLSDRYAITVADYVAPTTGTVTYVATSTPTPVGNTTSASTDAITPTLPTGTAAGDRVFVIQAGNNTNGGTPANWTSVATDTQVGPTGTAPGAGTGRRYVSVFYRDYDGAWSMPAFSLTSATQNTNAASVITLRKGASDIWNTPTVSTAGNTASAVTSYSVTTGSVTAPNGAMMLVGSATNDNVTGSAETLTGSAFALANLAERSDTGSATGNDVAVHTYTADVVVGGTGTLTHAVTLSGASEGGSVVVIQSATTVVPPRGRLIAPVAAVVRASTW